MHRTRAAAGFNIGTGKQDTAEIGRSRRFSMHVLSSCLNPLTLLECWRFGSSGDLNRLDGRVEFDCRPAATVGYGILDFRVMP